MKSIKKHLSREEEIMLFKFSIVIVLGCMTSAFRSTLDICNYSISLHSLTSILIFLWRKSPEVLGDDFFFYSTETCTSLSALAFERTMKEGADRQRTFG